MKKHNTLLAATLVAVSPWPFAAEVKLYDLEDFVRACLESSNKLSRSVCECAARDAAKELSPTGFEFLVATLRKDKDRSLALRHRLDPEELSTAGAFMATGPARCENGQEQAGMK